MFGIDKWLAKRTPYIHPECDGELDVDLGSEGIDEAVETGGKCSSCHWMSDMSDLANAKCNSCTGHSNFKGDSRR